MDWNQIFPSKYLKADALPEGRSTVTIVRVDQGRVGEAAQLKAVVHFKEFEQGLILNRTNATTLRKAFGDAADKWAARVIELIAREVDVRGEPMLGIRINIPRAQAERLSAAPESRATEARKLSC
jgi:hypothetical protein